MTKIRQTQTILSKSFGRPKHLPKKASVRWYRDTTTYGSDLFGQSAKTKKQIHFLSLSFSPSHSRSSSATLTEMMDGGSQTVLYGPDEPIPAHSVSLTAADTIGWLVGWSGRLWLCLFYVCCRSLGNSTQSRLRFFSFLLLAISTHTHTHTNTHTNTHKHTNTHTNTHTPVLFERQPLHAHSRPQLTKKMKKSRTK